MKKINYLVILFLIFQIAIGCNKEEGELDGKWPSMKWKTENIKGDVRFETVGNVLMKIYISGEGSVDLKCENYGFIWIASHRYFGGEEDWKNYQYEWLTVTVEDDIVHCNFDKPEGDFHKELYITLTAGDIFYSVTFIREEDFGPSGKWAPMEFTLQNVKGDVDMDIFSPYTTNFYVNGDCSFDIVCTNYADIWFLPGLFTEPELEDIYKFEAYWCDLTIEGNVIKCEIKNWSGEDQAAGLDVDLSAGEMYNNFCFYQKS